MIELIISICAMALFGCSIFMLVKLQNKILRMDQKLNERQDFFQTICAKEYVRLENRVKDIEKDIYPKP